MKLPKEVLEIIKTLEKGGFEAFAVGGCVRDLLLGKKPADWDITTNAKPEQIQKLFPDSVYENKFGTVGITTDSKDETLKFIEVTTYRVDEKYTDKRHPDEVKFTKNLEDDLARRDFTVNAMALGSNSKVKNQKSKPISKSQILASESILIDPFDGQKDLNAKLIRAVGKPEKRFEEDALRLLRAVRFGAQLSFEIEEKTLAAIKKLASSLRFIAKERIRDEFIKLIQSDGAEKGIIMLLDTELLHYIVPELEEGVGVEQNKHHIYTVFDHNVHSLGFAVKYGYNLETRLAALFHDIGKPKTKRGQGENSTFYGHEVVGARMTAKIMDRLRFPRKIAEKVITLVRYHLFYYNVDEVGEASVRRLVSKVGKENMPDLINLRVSERKGSGVPKAKPYKLRHLEFMIEKALREPLSLKELKINGNEIMKLLKIEPSPKVGYILNALMNEVLDEPKRNKKHYLKKRASGLAKIPEKDLKKLADEGKEKLSEEEEKEIGEIKKKYYVK